ncbi:MAG: hypothetical protein Q4P84_05390 [Elusimicrobiales bacterium]|nr:hypothetical protein [Elusimicrobiales bacterium]
MNKVQDLIEINGVYYPSMRDATPGDIDLSDAQDTVLTPAEQRELAYDTEPVIEWGGEMLTVTDAAQVWAYYAAERRTDRTEQLTALIAAAKESIRAKWPDGENI